MTQDTFTAEEGNIVEHHKTGNVELFFIERRDSNEQPLWEVRVQIEKDHFSEFYDDPFVGHASYRLTAKTTLGVNVPYRSFTPDLKPVHGPSATASSGPAADPVEAMVMTIVSELCAVGLVSDQVETVLARYENDPDFIASAGAILHHTRKMNGLAIQYLRRAAERAFEAEKACTSATYDANPTFGMF